jgi:hypothetical protein
MSVVVLSVESGLLAGSYLCFSVSTQVALVLAGVMFVSPVVFLFSEMRHSFFFHMKHDYKFSDEI